jgi:uncharacterized protein YlxW (UPF0749 family)
MTHQDLQPGENPDEKADETPKTPTETRVGKPEEQPVRSQGAGPLPPERDEDPAPAGETPPPAAEKAAADEAQDAPAAPRTPHEETGRRRLLNSLWPPRVTRAQLIVAVLLCCLGLGLALQVRSTNETSPLRGARQEDLVRILDEVGDRSQRLEAEKHRLEDQRKELENSSNQAEEARKQTAQKQRQLGILAGTVAAQGPGLHIRVTDPTGSVQADDLLNTVEELRAAGAEAIEVNNVRVVADTYFTGSGGQVRIDGHQVNAPYDFEVIGEPKDLQPALNIPGGVVQSLQKEQAEVTVSRSQKITVDALRSAQRPDYARSSSQ